jgi:ketosteroid isomerase-like protein
MEDSMIGALIARKAIAGAFDAMNQHDLPQFMSGWHEEGVFIYPGEMPVSGIFKGKDAVEKWFKNFFDKFPEIHFDVKDICVRNIFSFTGNNVVAVHWNIQLKNRNGRVGQNSGVSVITIKSGKVSQVKDFISDLGANFKLIWG